MIVAFIDQSSLGFLASAARAAQVHTLRNPMPIMIERNFILTPLNEVVRSGVGRRGEPGDGYE